MTKLLEQVIAEALALPDDEQDAMARLWLAEMRDDRRWRETSEKHGEGLNRLLEGVQREYEAGLTEPLDPDAM